MSIKRAQKEEQLFREISQLYQQASLDDARLRDVFVNRVTLSPDKGLCTVYFYTVKGVEHFDSLLHIMKLYKPSLRKAIASRIRSRYTPELIFRYDENFDKEIRIEQLIDKVSKEQK